MTESSNISWTERRVRLISDGEEATVWTPEVIEETWDDPNCLVRQLLRDVLAARSALSEAEGELDGLRESVGRLTDSSIYYRNLAIHLGAAETNMISEYDRKLCRSWGSADHLTRDMLGNLRDAWDENERLVAERDAALVELDAIVNIAGEALGTDPSHRTALGCVKALAGWFETLRAERDAAVAERDRAWNEAVEACVDALWGRIEREKLGHAKAAVTLDIETIRALARPGAGEQTK